MSNLAVRSAVFNVMLRSFIGFLPLAWSATAAWGQVYTINTLAGNGAAGFLDGPNTTAQFNLPGGIYVNSSGNVYVADGANNRVRLISGGSVSTVAGTGTATYAGDGAAASAAAVFSPEGVAGDSSGNLYIADTGNGLVRKIASGGTITTYAGNAGFGSGYSGDGGLATQGQLSNPASVVVDSFGNVYIADTGNNLIRKVTASNGQINTVVGSGSTAGVLSSPTGMAIDSAGNLYIANQGGNRIMKFTASTGRLSTFAGNGAIGSGGDGGLAILAQLTDPKGVAVDAAGNVYIADTVNHRIRKVTIDGIITTIAGNGKPGYSGDGGPAGNAQLYSPDAVAVDSGGNVYIVDTHNSVIRVLQPVLPSLLQGGVTNAASFKPAISPGALATAFGTGFGIGVPGIAATPNLPASAGGVSVTVNGRAAPLYYVSPNQINFQVPWETAVGTATVAVTVSGGTSNTVTATVLAAGPGLFYLPDSVQGNVAIVQNYDNPGYSLNSQSNPAAGGSTIVAYLTGTGPVSPAASDGAPTSSTTLVKSTSSWSATIGSAAAQVSFFGLTPAFVGLAQANIVVPSGLMPGKYALTVTIGNESSNPANIWVK